MTSGSLFNITTIFYMASTLAFFGYLAGRNQKVGLSGTVLAWIGFAIHTVATGLRWKESYDLGMGHAPLSNLYESVVFFAWSIVLIFGIIDAKYKYRVIGAFVMPFALLGMTWAQL
jgi:ABC-type transport system involved in cytochrome c biogenesis permease subunit